MATTDDNLTQITAQGRIPLNDVQGVDVNKNPLDYWARTSQNPYGRGAGAQVDPEAAAWGSFMANFGRAPTQQELGRVLPAFQGRDYIGGNAFVANLWNQEENTPEKQAAQKQEDLLAKAPQYYDQVNSQFQSTLGRDATDEEKKHFGSMLATGTTDPYTVGQWLSQLPESVKKQDTEFQNQLRSNLKSEDARYFNEQVLPGIQKNFSQAGRSFDSSAFANAAAQAGQQQNVNREGFLSNLSASQYQGNKANAYDAYLNSVGRYQGLQDYSMQRGNQLMDANTARTNQLSDFQMQKQAYDEYLQRYGKRSSGLGGLIGGLAGTGIGAYFGGATGALVGNQLGGGFGNYFGQ